MDIVHSKKSENVCNYRGRLLEPEYTYYDYTRLFLEKINGINLKYDYLEEEEAYIIYGYR